ncbi:hypothetical protein NUSPORA_01333 [Nucleospora cyclopteri]
MAVKLVTHSGSFHYDEILATAMLMDVYDKVKIIRTRDSNRFDEGNVVYDVGGVFDPENNKFDHHQKTFNETFSEKFSIKLSSAGLIYKYFHKKIFNKYNIKTSGDLYEIIRDKIYEEFLIGADAIDNGVDIAGEIKVRSVCDLVANFNQSTGINEEEKQKHETDQFHKALEIVRMDWNNYMNNVIKKYISQYDYIKNVLINTDSNILFLKTQIDHNLIIDIEKQLKRNILFIIYKKDFSMYRIYCVNKKKHVMETKMPLYKEWRGLRDQELEKVAGFEGIKFVHATGFTGGAATFEVAKLMCELTIKKSAGTE